MQHSDQHLTEEIDKKDSYIFESIFYESAGNRILTGIYLRFIKGEICGLFGSNGCGKTTLMKIGSGQLKATGGVTIIDGSKFTAPSCKERFQKIAYLPQESFLPFNCRVQKVIKVFPEEAQKALVKDDLITRLQNSKIRSLSGGELRYLELSLILSLNRKFVLIDEPYTGIEPIIIEKIQSKLLSYAQRGNAILITDHYYDYVLEIADHAYFMTNGQCQKLSDEYDLGEQLKRYSYIT